MLANKTYGSVVMAVVAVVLVGGTAYALAPGASHAADAGPVLAQDNGTNVTQDNATEATVTFEDRTSNGTVVFVESVTVPEGGFVTVHNESLFEGETVGSVVGVSEYLEAGTHDNVSVTLFNVSGVEFAQFSLDDGEQVLVAMPHRDTNANRTYDFVATDGAEDGPYAFANGTAVTDNATVSVGAAMDVPADNVTNVTADNETDVTVGNETNETG